MKQLVIRASICLVVAALGRGRANGDGPPVPLADHHQHLFSPALAELISRSSPVAPIAPITAKDLISHLDTAGIKRAAVLSTAYIFSQPSKKVEDDYAKVRADNDWTADQVAQYPDRLIGFCGLNPLKDYALPELARCAKNPHLRYGLKLHFANSVVDYHNARHIEQLRRVFRAANDCRMAIVVHMGLPISQKMPYGRAEALIFLNDLLPAAPDVPVQIAHLAGAGGYGDRVDQALEVFAEAVAKGDPRTRRLWFDVTAVVRPDAPPEQAALIAKRIRQLGVRRVLYGSDAPTPDNPPSQGWAAFRKLPLSEAEFRTIANNVAPYLARENPLVPDLKVLAGGKGGTVPADATLNATTHDAVYFRSFNFRAKEAERKARAVQCISHPMYRWQVLRQYRPGQYENRLLPRPVLLPTR